MLSADAWLTAELPQMMASSWYRDGGQIVVLYDTGHQDSGGNSGASGGQIPPILTISARTRRMGNVATPVNTAGVLRSVEQAYGVPFLGDAADPSNGSLVGMPVSTTPVPSFLGLYGVACPTSTTCCAVGYDATADADAVTTIINGVASPPAEVAGGGEWLNAISWPSATQCYAVGL